MSNGIWFEAAKYINESGLSNAEIARRCRFGSVDTVSRISKAELAVRYRNVMMLKRVLEAELGIEIPVDMQWEDAPGKRAGVPFSRAAHKALIRKGHAKP